MATRIIDWPPNLCPADAEWSLLIPKVGSTSAFDGAQFNKIIGPPRWTFTVTLNDTRKESLPEREAFLRRLRGGLNPVRAWDWRYTGMADVYAGEDSRLPGNLLPNSLALATWSRVGPAGTPDGTGVITPYTSDYYQSSAVRFRAGAVYVLALDIQAAASGRVALALDAEAFGEATGAVFDALDGSVVSTYGAALSAGSAPAAGGARRVYVTAKAVRAREGRVHAYPVLPSETVPVRMDRPQLAYAIGAMPPAYVATDGDASYGELQPRVNGGGQTGDTLSTRGWIPGVPLKAGFWISYGDGMHQLMDDAAVDDTGAADLWIEPPIRRPPADGQAIEFKRVTGLFMLTTDEVGFKQQNVVVPGITLTFQEILQ